ncbi:uncharacterized protein N7459_008530 [Penicillium hispanicum]|uniref:uncharacterized protein n=1 Tax=Penicillium hispanicum TaxID=1080232 RepID=UPI0025406FBC|nr:uncharacterized protein N7459_008530 [Penicillium hispanicum]KAJ5574103.1 hypothetical protein N7459_008530 [Penicillium hispanicum]
MSLLPRILLLWAILLHVFSAAIPVTTPDLHILSVPGIENQTGPAHPHEPDHLPREPDSTIEARVDASPVPGVDQINAKIISYGVVTTRPDLYYTRYPINQAVAMRWGSEYWDEDIGATKSNYKFAMWGRLMDVNWLSGTASTLRSSMVAAKFGESRIKQYEDMFMKNVCQAYGETSQGDIIVLMKDTDWPDNRFDAATAWGGTLVPAVVWECWMSCG